MTHLPRPAARGGHIVRIAAAAATLGLLLAIGCGAEKRKPLTDPDPEARLHDLQKSQGALTKSVAERLIAHIKHEQDEFKAGRRSEAPVINILALSGGGDYGAFGAGYLNGWGTIKDGPFKRPQFDAVTGVSTGSLIAPFAFVGTDKSLEQIEMLYCNPKPNWLADRGLLFFLPSNPSLMTIGGLKKSIYAAVNADLVREIAAQGETGRALLVSATNQDLGTAQVFDMCDKAKELPPDGNTEKFCQYLLASSAIPGAFPPVEIDGYLYGDGGVTANVLVRLDLRSPNGFIAVWRRMYPGEPLPHVRYWIIFNNQIQTPPDTVQPAWVDLAGRSLAISIRSSTMSEIRLIASEVDDLIESGMGSGEVFLTAIPNDWRPPVPGDFKKATMDSLAQIGRRMGAEPKSWIRLTIPAKAK